MKVNFLVSAFDGGFPEEFAAEVKRALSAPGRFVFVASDFENGEKSERYGRHFLHFFEAWGIFASSAAFVDGRISPEQARREIAGAELVWLSGGDTLKQMACLREYGLCGALREREGVTVGMSAGAINMARQVVLAKDESDNIPALSVYEGIGLVELNVEPHANAAGPEHWQEIREASRIAPIYCLYDGSFLVEQGGEVQAFGRCEKVFHGERTAVSGVFSAGRP